MTTFELITAWANRDAPSGREGNVSFEGECLMSYGTMIAVIAQRVVDAPMPMRMVLRNTKSYSQSTNRHQMDAHTAARAAGMLVIDVLDISSPWMHHTNQLGIAQDVMEKAMQAKRSRTYAAMHRDNALNRMDDFNRYGMFFGLPERYPSDKTDDLDVILGRATAIYMILKDKDDQPATA